MTITIYHECYSSTITPKVGGDIYSYTVLTPQTTKTLSTFTFTNVPVGVTCFKYSIYNDDNTT